MKIRCDGKKDTNDLIDLNLIGIYHRGEKLPGGLQYRLRLIGSGGRRSSNSPDTFLGQLSNGTMAQANSHFIEVEQANSEKHRYTDMVSAAGQSHFAADI